MKKSILLSALVCLLVVCFAALMVSCDNNDANDENETKGNVVFRVVGSSVQWKYDFESDDEWRDAQLTLDEQKPDPEPNEAYLLFKKAHPEYIGDEERWLDDLVNDRLIYYTSFTVSFDTFGGSEVEDQRVKLGQAATAPQTVPTRAGYKFVSWQNGDAEYDFSSPVIKNVNLKAKWEVVTYGISYDLRDCGVNSDENPATYNVESSCSLKAPAANDGFKFVGWEKVTTSADGTETSERIAEIPVGTYGDIKLRAVWEELVFKFELKEDDTYKVVGYYKDDYIVVIPSEYEGKPVTEIAENAFQSKRVMSVTLPKTLTTIGDFAFYHSRVAEIINLSKIDFTNAAFYDYGWITSSPKLVIKTSGTSDIYNVGDFYFLPFEGKEYLIYYAGTGKKVKIPNLGNGKKIVINAFAFEQKVDDYTWQNELEEVDMSANVCEVKGAAFNGCASLKRVIVGKSLTWLDNESFRIGSGLSAIDVYYLGTAEDWKNVTIDYEPEYKDMYYDMTLYYYSENKPTTEGKYWRYNESGEAVSW